MAELYILIFGTLIGAVIGLVGVLIGIKSYKSAIRPFTDPTPVYDTVVDKNKNNKDNIDTSPVEGLDWSEYDNYIRSLEEPEVND